MGSQTIKFMVCAGFILVMGYQSLPVPTGLHTLGDRLVYTLQWQLLSLLVLVSVIQKVADTRFSSMALNPVEGDQRHVTLYKNFLSSTFRQCAASVGSQLILATFLNQRQMIVIPLTVLIFVVGRIYFFWNCKDTSPGSRGSADKPESTFSIMRRSLKEGDVDTTSSNQSTILLSHQKNVTQRVLASLVCSAGFLWLGYTYFPFALPDLPSPADRLVCTAQWQIPSVALLVVALGTTWTINKDTNSTKLTAHGNFLTNTLEQYLANGMAQLILTTYLTPNQMRLIPLLVTLFLIGRLQYWYGYLDTSRGRSNKAFGFAMTFYVTVSVLMYCTYRFVGDLF